MNTYTASVRVVSGFDGSKYLEPRLSVRGNDHETAANHAAQRLYGRHCRAERVTGVYPKSGYFQAYRWDRKLGCWNSIGEPFHVG